MTRSILLAACALQTLFALVQASGYYSIISPGTLHPNSKYNVAVSVEQVTEPCDIKLTLEGPDFKQEKAVKVQPMKMENVEFVVPDVQQGEYKFSAEGVSGLIFSNTTAVNFADNEPYVYVQTDKATYKPGDLVQFRVIVLDADTRPAHIEKPVSILLKDGANNVIKNYANVSLTKGVFSDKLQLSAFPCLGNWEIEVQLNNNAVENHKFVVDKYVLPKFEVSIDVPDKVALAEEKFGFTVRAKYTFGKLVKGKAAIVIRSQSLYGAASPFRVNHYPRHFPAQRDQFSPRIRPPYGPPQYYPPPWHQEPSVLHIMEKNVELNGKAYIEFDMKDVISQSIPKPSPQKLTVQVTVEEALTGHKRNATAEAQLVTYSYIIDAPTVHIKCGMPNKTFTYAVTVSDLSTNPVTETKHPVSLYLTYPQIQDSSSEAYLNASGIATFELKCPSSDAPQIHSYKVQYREQPVYSNIHYINTNSPLTTELEAKVLTEKPKLDDDIEIQVRSKKVLSHITYVIVANGNIVKSGIVNLSEKEGQNGVFTVRATFDMIPHASLYIYYIEHDDLKFYETSFDIEKQFINKISIEAPKQSKPGEKITLKVDTYPDSYVGVMGVDQSVLLLKSGNDFNAGEILNNLHKLETRKNIDDDTNDPYPGARTGVTTMTNAHYPYNERPILLDAYWNTFIRSGSMPMAASSAYRPQASPAYAAGAIGPPSPPPPPAPRIRKQFLENWFFEDFPSSDKNGLTLTKKVPDTITSWIVTGFSLSPEIGFALTDSPTNIQSFRPFFITTNLPYAVKRGELVSIPVIVFSYMSQDLKAEITLINDDDEFTFSDSQQDQQKRVQHVSVAPDNPETVTFTIRPKKIGHITLKITVITPMSGDAIQKELRVEPEGVTIFKNHDFYVDASEGHNFEQLVKLDIPEEIVPDSEHIEVSVMGDILGSTVKNLNKLVRMPSGCGEQNMVNFVPNILVLRYLESTQQVNPKIESEAKRYIDIGYQRELTYKHDDGSYSAFGKSDAAGSTWLTAYVVRSFHEAAKYTNIDPKLLEQGLAFLASKQNVNGSFPEHGKLLDYSHQNDVGLTAFVLLAFLENEELKSKYTDVIDRGFQYLQKNAKATDDLYGLSVALYAMQLQKLNVVEDLLTELNRKAKNDGGHQWWTKSAAAVEDKRQWWRPKSHDVEITGYILMTLLERNAPVMPIAKWLIAQRNSNGGFASTQETVVGMQALISFAKKTSAGNSNLVVDFSVVEGGSDVGKFDVNKQNALTMQSIELPNAVRAVKFEGKGTGVAIMQVSYRYNILDKEKKPSFILTAKPTSFPMQLNLEVSTEFVPQEADRQESNMVVMEVTLPSGYTAVLEALEKIKQDNNVMMVETKKEDTNVIIYFDSLVAAKPSTVTIEAERTHEVADQKPVPIVVYDYYDSQQRATEFYQVDKS